MALATFYKQSYEEFPISVDFSENMAEAETITSQVISAIDVEENDATADVLTSPVNDGAQSALVKVLAGTTILSPYKITFRIVTTEGNKWEMDILMKVKEL